MITRYKRQQQIMYWALGFIGFGVVLFFIVFAPRYIRIIIPLAIVLSIVTGVLILLGSMHKTFYPKKHTVSLFEDDKEENINVK